MQRTGKSVRRIALAWGGRAAVPLRHWLAGIAVGLALIAPWAALRAQQSPDLDLAQTLLAEGQAAQVYEMLAPFEAQLAGDLRFDYLLARSALDSGKPSIASFIYERILAVEPNYAGVRLENGRAYLELEDFARAKQEFETVLAFENLPPDLQGAAEQYLRIAEERLTPKRTFFNAFAEYGFGHDDNVNSAIAEEIVPLPGGLLLLLDPLSRERDDFYHALTAGAEVQHFVTERWSVFAGADYRARLHLTETIFDFHDLGARVGVGYNTGRHLFRLSGRLSRFFIDDTALRDLGGATLEWRHAVDDRNQVSATASYLQYRFRGAALETLDFDSYGIGVGWNHGFLDGRALLGVTANVGYEDAQGERLDGNKRVGGLGLSLQGVVTDTIGAFLFAGVQRGNHDERNVLFAVRRHDTLYNAGGGVSWRFAKGWSLRPQLTWTRSASNIELNDYKRMDVSLSMRKDF